MLLYLVIAAVVCALSIGAGTRYLVPLWQARHPVADQDRRVASEDLKSGDTARISDDVLRSPEVVSAEPQAGPANVAIVMDDCGPSIELAKKAQALDLPITWSILPNQTYSKQIAKMLRDAHVPFLVHVPMQAQVDPDGKAGEKGMYYIGVGMSDTAVARALSGLIDSLPGAYGINNHRGSRATEDERTMRAVMDELARRKMFFLDSNTSTKTLAYEVAKAKGLRTLKNGHFLDNEPDRKRIAAEMKATIETAKKRGDAVVICHLRPETVAFLENLAGWDLTSMGVRLVTLPQLIDLQSNTRR